MWHPIRNLVRRHIVAPDPRPAMSIADLRDHAAHHPEVEDLAGWARLAAAVDGIDSPLYAEAYEQYHERMRQVMDEYVAEHSADLDAEIEALLGGDR